MMNRLQRGIILAGCSVVRSKISADGNNLSPRNGLFSARVRAAGGTVASANRRAVGDEGEFDFDSNRNDIAAGADCRIR